MHHFRVASTLLLACSVFLAQETHAAGPWNLGPFSTAGDFPTAQAACENHGRFTLLVQSAIMTGVKIRYSPMIGAFGSAATCEAIGRKGDQIVTTQEVSISYDETLAQAIYDPTQCDLFTEDGACYIENDSFNYGSPRITQVETCTNGPDASIGNPINIATGNKYQREVDVEFSGESGALALVRHYNSQDTHAGLFGLGWHSELDSKLSLVEIYDDAAAESVAQTRRVVKIGDGTEYTFRSSNGTWVSSPNVTATLVQQGSEFLFNDGSNNKYTFNSDGNLVNTTTPHNLVTHFNYVDGILTSMQDAYGNTISFVISNGTISSASIMNFGTFTYKYEGQRLTSVLFDGHESDLASIEKQYLYEDPNFEHLLTGIIDEEGRQFATWSYDEQGRAITSEHGLEGAEKFVISYDSSLKTTVTNAAGKERVYRFASVYGVKQILRVDDKATETCPNSSQLFSYDQYGMLETVTNGEGAVTRYVREASGREILKQEGLKWTDGYESELAETPDFREVETNWYELANVPMFSIVRGNDDDGQLMDYRRTDYTLGANNRVEAVKVTDLTNHTVPYSTADRTRTEKYIYTYYPSSARVQSLEVDGPRDAAEIAGGLEDSTVLNFNERGLLTSSVNALGHSIDYSEHTPLGLPRKITDENDVIARLTYDTLSQLDTVTIETIDGVAVTDYDYLKNGLLGKVTLPDDSSVQFEYNEARHLTEVQNNFGEVIEITPNKINGDWTKKITKTSSDIIWSVQEQLPNELGMVMDVLGQADQLTRLIYNRDNQIKTKVEHGHSELGELTTNYSYDELGRPSLITDAKNGEITVGYNPLDKATSVVNALGQETTYVVDGFGDVIRETSPDRGTRDYTYDAAGNLIKVKDANATSTLKYDALNRLVESSDTKGGMQTWVYDLDDEQHEHSIGRVSQRVDAAGTTNFSYNELGLLTSESLTNNAFTVTTSYEFDLAGNLTGMVYPGGRRVNFQLDSGRISDVTTQATENDGRSTVAKDVGYAPFGEPNRITYGNGVKLIKDHDLDGRLDTMRLSFGDTTLLDTSYAYDNFNNLRGVNYENDPDRDKSYSYDALHNIEKAEGQYGVISYDYDAIGNRTSRSITRGSTDDEMLETYTYSPLSSRLESVEIQFRGESEVKSFTHDGAGNITGINGGAGGTSITLEYDAQNQLNTQAKN